MTELGNLVPNGNGVYIWKIKNCEGGDVDAIADKAVTIGLDFLAVKINEGYRAYNLRPNDEDVWIDDYIPLLKAACDTRGIKLYGWGGVWMLNGVREANMAINRVKKFDLAGYFIDAESTAKKSPDRFNQAIRFTQAMRNMPGPVGLNSYRYPLLHPELPWNELLACSTFHAPQVYWVGANNPAEQLERSMNQLTKKAVLPYCPAGPAYSEFGWRPTIAEMDEFYQTCFIDPNIHGIVWWEWSSIAKNNFWDAIASYSWKNEPILPPLPPSVNNLTDRVCKLEDDLWLLTDILQNMCRSVNNM